jgi:hypothetical protein
MVDGSAIVPTSDRALRFGGFPTILISVYSILLLAHAVAGATIPVTQMPALYVSDYGEGRAHPINSYTLQPDQDISGGAWMLLGTNDH